MIVESCYGRVSTSNQENEGTIETQLSAIKEFVQKNNYTIVQEYLDDGWSGDNIVRPALDQLRMDAKKKIWEAVLMYDPDRLARRYSYQELVMDELKEVGVEVIFVTIPTPKNNEDKILNGVRGLFAEYERAKIAERFRLGKLRKVKEGHILTTSPLYGYEYVPKQQKVGGEKIHGYYKINEEEAGVVKMIFGWVANEKLTIRSVVRRLQEMGIKPRKSKRGVWSISTLTTLLRHKGYIGEAHWGSSYAVVPEKPLKIQKYKKMKKTSRRIRPESEWYKIPILPIIDEDLFYRARAQLESNFKLCQRNKKNEYLSANLIYCSCGRKRAGEGPQHGKHLYYRCTDRVYSFPLPPRCKETGINARITDRLVWEGLSNLMISSELMQEQVNRWMSDQKDKVQVSIGDISFVEKEINKLKNEEDRYNKAYGAGVFTIGQLKEYTIPIREKLIDLEAQRAKIQRESHDMNSVAVPDEKEISSFAKESIEFFKKTLNFEKKREIVIDAIDKIIGTRERLQVYGFIPIKELTNVEYKTIHRYYWFA